MLVDFKLTDDGQFVLGANGDLELVYGDEARAQQILFRLKTQKGDWTLSPTLGADLEQFIGASNNRNTRDLIEQAIYSEIQKDIGFSSLDVKCISVDDDQVFILITFQSIEDPKKQVQVSSSLDLRTGKVFARTNIN